MQHPSTTVWGARMAVRAAGPLTRHPSSPAVRGLKRVEKSKHSSSLFWHVGVRSDSVFSPVAWQPSNPRLLRTVQSVFLWVGGKSNVEKIRSGGSEEGNTQSLWFWRNALYGLKPLYDTLPAFLLFFQWISMKGVISCICSAEHKVIIVGLDNAGKTTILYQL